MPLRVCQSRASLCCSAPPTWPHGQTPIPPGGCYTPPARCSRRSSSSPPRTASRAPSCPPPRLPSQAPPQTGWGCTPPRLACSRCVSASAEQTKTGTRTTASYRRDLLPSCCRTSQAPACSHPGCPGASRAQRVSQSCLHHVSLICRTSALRKRTSRGLRTDRMIQGRRCPSPRFSGGRSLI